MFVISNFGTIREISGPGRGFVVGSWVRLESRQGTFEGVGQQQDFY